MSRIPGIELCVLVPDRWKHYGHWRYPNTAAASAQYKLEVGKIRCPWVGPAQYYLHWYPQLAQYIKSFKPDIIDLWEEPWGLVSAQACRLRDRIAPNALILSETEQNINKNLPFPFEQIRSYSLSKADWAIGRSPEAVDVLRAKGYGGPATVVPNAVDTTLFRPLDKQECRSRIGLTGFVVGFLGRMVAEKGVEDLISMLEHCEPNVSVVFAGEGPMLPRLKRAVEQLGKTDRVHFLGNIASEDLPTLINALDVLALPSHTTPSWKEQFGRVIIEALACSVPVVGSNSGAIPSIVGKCGIIVPERSPASLARAVTALQSDPGLLRELGEAGLVRARAEYSWETVAKKMTTIYQEMLALKSAPVVGRSFEHAPSSFAVVGPQSISATVLGVSRTSADSRAAVAAPFHS